MAYDKAFSEFVSELLAGLGELRIRPMFGGAGVYLEDLMFAILDDEVLWLRVDGENEDSFRDAGSRQFTYLMKDGRVMAMSYWSLPENALDDPDEAVGWARGAVEAAMRKAAGKKRKTSKA